LQGFVLRGVQLFVNPGCTREISVHSLTLGSISYLLSPFDRLPGSARRFQQQVQDVIREGRVFGEAQVIREQERDTVPLDRTLQSGSPVAAVGKPLVH